MFGSYDRIAADISHTIYGSEISASALKWKFEILALRSRISRHQDKLLSRTDHITLNKPPGQIFHNWTTQTLHYQVSFIVFEKVSPRFCWKHKTVDNLLIIDLPHCQKILSAKRLDCNGMQDWSIFYITSTNIDTALLIFFCLIFTAKESCNILLPAKAWKRLKYKDFGKIFYNFPSPLPSSADNQREQKMEKILQSLLLGGCRVAVGDPPSPGWMLITIWGWEWPGDQQGGGLYLRYTTQLVFDFLI